MPSIPWFPWELHTCHQYHGFLFGITANNIHMTRNTDASFLQNAPEARRTRGDARRDDFHSPGRPPPLPGRPRPVEEAPSLLLPPLYPCR